MTTNEGKPLALEYAPPLPWHRRRNPWLIAATIVTALSLCGWYWRDPIAERARFQYWQRKCLTYAPPSDLVVFDSDPVRGAELAASDTRYRQLKNSRSPTWFRPLIWKKIPHVAWEPGPAFVHGRRARGGGARLVVIELTDTLLSNAVGFYARVAKPEPIWTDPKTVRRGTMVQPYFLLMNRGETIRLYAGQTDADDESHFTIAYEIVDRRGIIDGWLQPDDTVKLAPREADVSKDCWTNSIDKAVWHAGAMRSGYKRQATRPGPRPVPR